MTYKNIELNILITALIEPEYTPMIIKRLEEKHFPNHQTLFKAILGTFKENMTSDLSAVIDWAKNERMSLSRQSIQEGIDTFQGSMNFMPNLETLIRNDHKRELVSKCKEVIKGESSLEELKQSIKLLETGSQQNDTIENVIEEFETMEIKKISVNERLDDAKVFVRGAVTRIGAYSNMGKSKFGYAVIVEMLLNGHNGIIFSTEVQRTLILANLRVILEGKGFWDIVDNKPKTEQSTIDVLKNLQIYDTSQGARKLEAIEGYIERSGHIDFVMTDFCQEISVTDKKQSEYERLTQYAEDIQSIAQKYDICWIDLSQLANDSVKNDYKASGFIPFKGSGALQASADIGIMITGDKQSSQRVLEVRKHKFFKTLDINIEMEFAKGTVKYIDQLDVIRTQHKKLNA